FLASSASSCAVERTFSLAADFCSSGRGSLKPRTIEQCAQKIINTYSEFSEKQKN
ncbi:hypothetical protein VP01_6029g1, partial [Puccinia sorghi]